MHKTLTFTLIILFALNGISQTWAEKMKVLPSDLTAYDRFGWAISMDGNIAIIGAPLEDEDSLGGNPIGDSGSAYVVEKDGNGDWVEIQKLTSSDRDFDDNFGYSVAVNGNYAVIGAWYEDEDTSGNNTLEDAGAAYVFERNSSGEWAQVQKLVASDREEFDRFGNVVAIHGNYAIVGAQYEDEDAMGSNSIDNAGSAYIFERKASGVWEEVQKLTAPAIDRGSNDLFGGSASISGDFAVVGAYRESGDLLGGNIQQLAGAAYIFQRKTNGNWEQIQKVLPSDRKKEIVFGSSMVIDENDLIVSAAGGTNESNPANPILIAGAAYIFHRMPNGTWEEVQKIYASEGKFKDQFGYAIDISGDLIVAGSWNDDEDSNGQNPLENSGSAYIFQKGSDGIWVEKQKIVASDREEEAYFGYSAAIDGETVVVGAVLQDQGLTDAGAAYIFEVSSALSLNKEDFGKSISVFPNPSSGTLNIDLGESYKDVSLSLQNTLGQIIHSEFAKKANNITIQVEVPSGIYLLDIQTKSGKSATLKVILE